MVIVYSEEDKWYHFTVNGITYVVRLAPIGQSSVEILAAEFYSRDDVDGEPVATVTVSTLNGTTGDLKTAVKEVAQRETLFAAAAKHAAQDWISKHPLSE